jgi:hypothetical protein
MRALQSSHDIWYLPRKAAGAAGAPEGGRR